MKPLETRITSWGGFGCTATGVVIALIALFFGPMIATSTEIWVRHEKPNDMAESPIPNPGVRPPVVGEVNSNVGQAQAPLQLLTPLNGAEFGGCVQFEWMSGGLNPDEHYEIFLTRTDTASGEVIQLSSVRERMSWQPPMDAPAVYRWRVVVYDSSRIQIRKQSTEFDFTWKGGLCNES